MKHTSQMLVMVCLLATLAASCATAPSSDKLGAEYLAKAQAYEQEGDLAAALEQYQLTLTVQPGNQTAKAKVDELTPRLKALAHNHYRTGLQFYKMGQYPQARQAFLAALRCDPEHRRAREKLAEFDRDISGANTYILHTLKSGETISSIAENYYGDYRKFHIIAKYNAIEDATRLKTGQTIKVPVIKGMPIIADVSEIRSEDGKPADRLDEDVVVVKRYVRHVVKPGESLSQIAGQYYGDFKKYDVIAEFNGLPSAAALRAGMELKVPETADTPLISGEPVDTAAQPLTDMGAEGDMPANYFRLGREFYDREVYDGAVTEFTKVLNAAPDNAEAKQYLAKSYYAKGNQAYQQADYPLAIQAFENALQYDKNCGDCRQRIESSRQKSNSADEREAALTLYQNKQYAQAITKLEYLAKANPQDAEIRGYLAKAHYQQGLALFEQEKYLEARDAFKAALTYDPECEKCEPQAAKSESVFKDRHYRLGLAEFQQENLNEAIHQWEMVYQIDPNYRDVKRNLEKARTLLKRLETIKRSQTPGS